MYKSICIDPYTTLPLAARSCPYWSTALERSWAEPSFPILDIKKCLVLSGERCPGQHQTFFIDKTKHSMTMRLALRKIWFPKTGTKRKVLRLFCDEVNFQESRKS